MKVTSLNPHPAVIPLDDAALEIGVHRATLYNWRKDGMRFMPRPHNQTGYQKLRFVKGQGRDALGRPRKYSALTRRNIEKIEDARAGSEVRPGPVPREPHIPRQDDDVLLDDVHALLDVDRPWAWGYSAMAD